MSPEEIQRVVDALDAVNDHGDVDPEAAHDMADKVLLSAVPVEVRGAYQRLVDRTRWWAAA